MTQPLLRAVTARERETYRRDGVVHLQGIYPKDWVQRLRTAMEDVFAQSAQRLIHADTLLSGNTSEGASTEMGATLKTLHEQAPEAQLAVEAGGEICGRNIVETDACGWHRGMREHHIHSPLVEIVAQLTESRKINLYSDQLFFKEAGSRVKTPWHQDKPYWLVDGGEMAVAWVPVDAVRVATGAMGYVRGSHSWGKLFKPSDFQTETGTFPEVAGISHDGLELLDHAALQTADMIFFDADPGDVIIHDWRTLHCSTGNTSAEHSRRAASVRYALDGCHYFQRPSSPEPFRNTLQLPNGAPLEQAARFPVVWPRPGTCA